MIFDLHTHTAASDGDLDAKGIIEEAVRNGVTKIAITDHDTVKNVSACIKEGEKYGIEVIPGIEITANYHPGKMHILGLGVDIDNPKFISIMEFFKKSREEKTIKTLKILNELLKYKCKIEFTLDDIKKFSNGDYIGRPHFAKAMIDRGIVKDVREAFDEYLTKPSIDNIKRALLTPEATIGLINEVGGIAVLAHPYSLKLSDKETYDKILELKSYGLAGIEVYHSDHSDEQKEFYKSIAEKEDFVITCGSDFHGKVTKPKIELGKGINSNLPSSDEEIFNKFYEKLIFVQKQYKSKK